MSVENKMQKRLLPQSPISCYHKQPTQKRQTQSKRKDATPALLSVTALCRYCMPQCIMQLQKVEQSVASNSYRQASQHPQLCPLSQSSSSQCLQSDHSPQTPKRPARWQGIQLTSHSEEMPWHVVAAEGEPQFYPAAQAQSVALHMAYQGCEDHRSGIAVLSLVIAGEFTTVKQIPVSLV